MKLTNTIKMVFKIENRTLLPLKVGITNQCRMSIIILSKILLCADVTHKWVPQVFFITKGP